MDEITQQKLVDLVQGHNRKAERNKLLRQAAAAIIRDPDTTDNPQTVEFRMPSAGGARIKCRMTVEFYIID